MKVTDGICLEEMTGCDSERQTLPFRFKYLFTKDPCEKCLVRAACNFKCEPKYAHWDQLHSVKEWKGWFPKFIKNTLTFSMIALIISAALFIMVIGNGGCKKVNQKRAVQYYDQEVKNYPNSNE